MDASLVPAQLRWDRADRLAKSLHVAEISVAEMAEYLGVHRNTVSGYLNRRIRPNKRTLSLWALRTGAPYDWLVDGDSEPQQPPPDSPSPTPTRATAAAAPASEGLHLRHLHQPNQNPGSFSGLVTFLSDERARRDSNSQPSDPKVNVVIPILRRAC